MEGKGRKEGVGFIKVSPEQIYVSLFTFKRKINEDIKMNNAVFYKKQ